MPHSSAFERFRESFFGDPYMAWHDGLDTDSLHELDPEERAEAEQMLLGAIDSGDPRIMTGLGELESTRAVEQMKARLPEETGDMQISLAVALWKIASYPQSLDYLIKALKSRQFWSVRMDAARALAEFATASDPVLQERAEKALIDALHDSQDLVRSHAADSLVTLHGLDPQDSPYDQLSIGVMSDNVKERKKAIDALLAALQQAGGT